MTLPATLEKIVPDYCSSFKILELNEQSICKNPHWHFHPEYEIVFISNGRGKRQVGNHLSFFQDGDLLVLGPYLPHYRFSIGGSQKYTEIALQISPDLFDLDFFELPELSHISNFKELAQYGLSYPPDIKELVGGEMVRMAKCTGFERVQLLLSVLNMLAVSKQYKVLNSRPSGTPGDQKAISRLQKIYSFVERNYKEHIMISEIADEICLTVPYTCRFIKKHTNKTMTEIINEFRISKACDLLIESNLNVSEISFEVGFNNVSYFNKQFRVVTGTTPLSYKMNYFHIKPSN